MIRFLFTAPLLSLLIAGCGQPETRHTSQAKAPGPDSVAVAELDTAVVEYNNSIPFTKGYVLSRDTVAVRQAPSELSKLMEKAGYGTSYEVIGEQGDWLAVWSRERHPYEMTQNGKKFQIISSRKVFIPKSAVGKFKDLKLYKEDIAVISAFSKGNADSDYYESGRSLDNYLSFELITKQAYLQKKKSRTDQVVHDTLAYPKTGGRLILPTASQKKNVYEDSPEDAEESYASYEYIGHVPSLQQYILKENGYESQEYSFIDMQTGNRTATLIDYPHISPDGRYILALYTSQYENCEDVEIYRVTGKKIERVAGMSFPHWMAGVETGDVFFAKDGCLYLPVCYNLKFYTENGDYSKPTQFMRIRIKHG